LHVSVVDNKDYSTVEVWVLSPKQILIVPQVRTSENALKRIVKKNIGCVVVVEGKKPVGIVTERDVSRRVAKSSKLLVTQVRRVMSSPLITATRGTPIDKAVYLMAKHGIRRLPVIDREELVGLVSERDLLRWMLQVSYEPQVPIEIRQILARRAEAKT